MRKVIVNSTPLISLCKVGMLNLLKKMYGDITIPISVFEEVSSHAQGCDPVAGLAGEAALPEIYISSPPPSETR